MKKYIYYGFGAAALALLMGGLPAAAFADSNSGEGLGGVGVSAEATTQVRVSGVDASTSASVQGEGRPSVVEQQKPKEQEHQTEAASSSDQAGGEATSGDRRGGEMEGLPFRLESTTTPAFSFGELKQSIEKRGQELEQELASSSPADRAIIANANPVRLAVHSLLASKDLLGGGIGQQVSQIAQQVSASVATTTNAEAQIESRSFFTKLLFGGDSAAAQVITQQVAQNQQRIDDLTKLLGQANVSADIQTTLTAQITALQDAQTRLQDLAQKEQSMWGIFSWRF